MAKVFWEFPKHETLEDRKKTVSDYIHSEIIGKGMKCTKLIVTIGKREQTYSGGSHLAKADKLTITYE